MFVADRWLGGGNRKGLLGSSTLTFSRDVDGDQLAVATGCNGLTATVSIADDRLRLLGYGRTEMACGAEATAQEEAFVKLLTGEPAVRLTDADDGQPAVLVLGTDADGLVSHERAPAGLNGSFSYQGTRGSTPIGMVTTYAGLRAELTIGTEGWTYRGCVGIHGPGGYADRLPGPTKFAVGPISGGLTGDPVTPPIDGACGTAPGVADEDTKVRGVLTGGPLTIGIVDQTVTLTAADGTALTFVAR